MNVLVNDDLFLGTFKTIDEQKQTPNYSNSDDNSEEREDLMFRDRKLPMKDRRQTFLRAQGLGTMDESHDAWTYEQDESIGS